MRDKLADRSGLRWHYTATFERFGKKTGWRGREAETILLIDVRDAAGAVITDHLWLTYGKQFRQMALHPGDRIAFDARVKPYLKGYRGRRDVYDKPLARDFKLARPTNVRKLTAHTQLADQLPLFE